MDTYFIVSNGTSFKQIKRYLMRLTQKNTQTEFIRFR